METKIRSEVQKLHGYTLNQPPHRVKLNQNESPCDLPEGIKKKVLERLASIPWNRYPTPFADSLRQAIARRESWSAEGVVVSGGSNVLIQAVMIASAVKGKILTVGPSFSLYEIEGALLGNKVVTVPLDRNDFSLPLERFLKTLTREKPGIVFLANPNAPTGNLFDEDAILTIVRVAGKKGIPMVVDEAYYAFSGHTLAPFLREFKNLILIRTFSKAYSLWGVRLGYLLADPGVAAEIRKVILPFSVGVLTQAVGEVVLEDDSYVSTLVNGVIEAREFLYQGLKELPGLTIHPSRTNFVLFQSPRAKVLYDQLVANGILIRNVSAKDLPDALRVTVGTQEENLLFLKTLRSLLRKGR